MPENLLDSPILYSLALTLLHFLWQGCLIALVLKCLLSGTSYKNPQLRYFWSTTALITCLILPIITFSIIYTPDYLNVGQQALNSMAPFDANQQNAVINSDWYQVVVDSLPFLSLAWMIVVLISSIKLLFALQQVNRLSTTDTIAVNNSLQARFEQLIEHFNLWRKPQLLISLKTEVPMAIGWLKPVILLPAAMMSGLTSAQLEMLILHELAHIRRHDYLVNFLQTLVEILLFFHPGVRWISKQMRYEREYCSDDIAVKHCGNAIAYAHTLADTASLCHKHRHSSIPAMAMAASGGDLKQRVVRLIDQEHTCITENDSGKLLASIVILFAILSVFAKPFVDNSIIDWGSGRISLMQSASELLQRRVDNDDDHPLSQTSIAQQLVEQNTSEVTTLSSDNNTAITAKTIQRDDESALLVQTIQPVIDTSTNLSQLKMTPIANEVSNEVAIEVPTNKILAQAKTIQANKDRSSDNLNVTKLNNTTFDIQSDTKNTPKLVKENTQTIQNRQKTISDLAFERSDSSNAQSQFKNPYANQVASLIEEPLPENLGTIEFNNSYTQVLTQEKKTVETKQMSNDDATRLAPINKASAKLISSVEPRYPSVAKRKGIEIDVFVKFVINKDGRVSDIEFEDTNKVNYFRNSIRTAMNKWRFLPAKINEKPIESQMAKIFSFSLIKG